MQANLEQTLQEPKAKKPKKSKSKSSVSSDGGAPTEPVVKTKAIVKQENKEEDVSVKTDSGIVDEPAAKKKSKSKKQREKKAAAAALAASQASVDAPKDSQPKEKLVIDLTPQAVAPAATKPKDKKKKPKSATTEQKPKEDNKVQFDQ